MKRIIAPILALLALSFTMHVFSQDYQTKGSGDSPKKMNANTSVTKPPETPKQDTTKSKIQGPAGSVAYPGTTATVTTSTTAKTTGRIYDPAGNLIATMDKEGWIRDPGNRVLAQYTKTGEYYNRNRVKVGYAANSVIYDKDGNKLGRVTREGGVYDAGDRLIGQISKDGIITDVQGTKLGSAPGVDKNVAALLFFYQNQAGNAKE